MSIQENDWRRMLAEKRESGRYWLEDDPRELDEARREAALSPHPLQDEGSITRPTR